MTPIEFHSAIMAYCYATRGSVTSLGRTVTQNQKVGGVLTSYHLVWLAADVVYDFGLALTFRQVMAKRFGLEVVVEKDHDHLEPIFGGQ